MAFDGRESVHCWGFPQVPYSGPGLCRTPMILMAPCIIDFIGANGLRGPVGGKGALDTPGPLNGNERSECHLGPVVLLCWCCVGDLNWLAGGFDFF